MLRDVLIVHYDIVPLALSIHAAAAGVLFYQMGVFVRT